MRSAWVAVATTAIVAGVPALAFARTGARTRSGYELVRTAQSAGVLEGAVGRTAIVALALLPLLAAASLAAASLRRPLVVATLTFVAGCTSVGVGAAVLRAPSLEPLAGAAAAVVAGLGAVAAAIGLGAVARR